MRLFLTVALFVLSSFVAAQSFTVGFRANFDELVILGTAEVATGQLGDIRVSPIVQAQVRTNYTDFSGHVMGGLQFLWLPPDSTVSVIATVLYRHVWRSLDTPSGPELAVTVVF